MKKFLFLFFISVTIFGCSNIERGWIIPFKYDLKKDKRIGLIRPYIFIREENNNVVESSKLSSELAKDLEYFFIKGEKLGSRNSSIGDSLGRLISIEKTDKNNLSFSFSDEKGKVFYGNLNKKERTIVFESFYQDKKIGCCYYEERKKISPINDEWNSIDLFNEAMRTWVHVAWEINYFYS